MSTLDPATLPDPPAPQLSPFRVVVALLVVLVAVAGGVVALRHTTTDQAAAADAPAGAGPWFAPYVDATLTPTVAFQDRSVNPARDVVLGFVVAGKRAGSACTPTWGTYHTLEGAATAMDLDRRIAQLRGQGGDVVISFGGQANTELAVACDRPDELVAAYRAVVARYASDTIDFDIEGAALSDATANARRARAVKTLQDEARARRHHLAVWLTLPVTTQGMDAGALAVVRAMLDAHVDVAGVNVMAMDFNEPVAARHMRTAVQSAVVAARGQVAALFGHAGLNARHLWAKVGMTVMIGQNDVAAERLSVADAQALVSFARRRGLGRVSLWSLNRDVRCGVTFAVVGTHSDLCSGVAQQPQQFSRLFARLGGSARRHAAAATTRDALPEATTRTVDDPARSPYPIWQPEQAYREGYKVVWHQAVYVAKWYTQGQTPDAPDLTAGATPWRLIGPVLRGDRAPRIKRLPAGTYAAWSPTKVFRAGARVLFHGLPYQASWYTVGDAPGDTGANGSVSPWKPLYRIPGEPVG